MERHVRILGILHIVVGAFFLIIGLLIAAVLFGGGALSQASGGDQGLFFLTGILGTIVTIVFTIMSLPLIVAGYGILHHYSWARILGIILGVINLFNPPIGTIFGIYSLWVLLSYETAGIFQGRH